MDTLRLLGSKTPIDDKVLEELLGPLANVSGMTSAAQCQSTYGATITFKSPKDLSKVLKNLHGKQLSPIDVDTDFSGLTVLYCPRNPVVDIIAVHGFGGHGFDTWTSDDEYTKVMWLRDILPKEIPNARVMTFGYSSGTTTRSTASMSDVAKSLLASIVAKRQHTEYQNQGRPIIFIAHSFGGLVVKRALVISQKRDSASQEVQMATKGLLFFGTPHRGASPAKYGKILVRIASAYRTTTTQNLDTLKENSQELMQLNEDFSNFIPRGSIRVVSFYETRKTKVQIRRRVIVWRSIKVVNDYSAVMGIQDEEPVPLEADHLDMTRYRSAGSHNCVLVLHQLREIVAGQIRCCQRRFPITIPEHLPDTSALQQRVGYNEKIEEALMPMDVPTLQPACCVLYGLGGVGKSKMALVFMEQHREVYDYMFFLGADKTPKLAQGFANIARLLKLGDAETLNDPSSARSVVLNWLQTTRRWLLVFDNVDDALVLDNFWPFRSQGAILITCRNANITSTLPQIRAKIVEIHGFAENEATKFLLNQPGIETKDAATVNASRSIAKKLGYLPMALMIIGAFASESRSTLIEIDQFLRNGAQTDLLSHESDATARLYEHTWETIWASDLASLNRKTTEFLNVISLLDPDHIPKDLFHHDMLEYIKMLMPLEKYSFVEKTNTHDLKVHRLVQHRQLDRMSNEELNMAFDSATKLVRDAFPKQILGMHMYKFWPKCEQFLPHVLAIEVAYTERHPHLTQADEFVDMMCDCSWYLFETSQLEEALQPLCTAETLCKRTIGEDSLSMARIHVGRALVLAHQNKYNEAGPLYEKALEIREKHLPQNDQLLANSYMQVALFRTHQCRLPEAITAHKKAIDIRSNSDRHAPPLMALSYINLSRCLLMTEQWGELEQVLSRSEECFRDLSAEERATHASLIGYIRGNMKLGQGKVEEALSDHLNNCERTKKAYGNHYYTAAAYHKVAVIQISLGNRSAAISSLFSALEILEKLRGASISGRKSRSEILLSNQLLLEGEAEKARAMRARAFDHYFEATGSRIEDQTNVDFDLLVPFNDR